MRKVLTKLHDFKFYAVTTLIIVVLWNVCKHFAELSPRVYEIGVYIYVGVLAVALVAYIVMEAIKSGNK